MPDAEGPTKSSWNDGPSDSSDARARARLIDSIYEAVLRPEHYDEFMSDWADHREDATRQLDNIRIEATGPEDVFDDTGIEAHFRRAYDILERMGRGPGENGSPEKEEATGFLVASTQGAIRFLSDPARETFGAADRLEDLSPCLDTGSEKRLADLVDRARRAPNAHQHTVLIAENASGTASKANLLVARVVPSQANQRYEIVINPLTIDWDDSLRAVVCDAFQLTPRELELTEDVSRGLTLAAISQKTGRKENTLRSQLKAVFRKTHTSSQADLVRIMATMPRLSSEDAILISDATLVTGSVVNIALLGGESVPVHILGPDDGTPVIFIHGMLDGVAVTARVHEELVRHNIRLIAPIRPNFGAARVETAIRDAPDVFAKDVLAVIEHLQLSRPLLLGHMAGSVYAFAAASILGSRIGGIISVSGGVPILSRSQFSCMAPRQRTVAYTARFAPSLLPVILRTGISLIDGASPEKFMNALYAEGTRDRQVVQDSEIAGAIVDGYRFSVAQGVLAFQTDSWHVTRNWSKRARTPGAKTLILHGAHDPVVSIDSVREFASIRADTQLVELEGEGQLLLYSAPERAFDEIAAFAAGID